MGFLIVDNNGNVGDDGLMSAAYTFIVILITLKFFFLSFFLTLLTVCLAFLF